MSRAGASGHSISRDHLGRGGSLSTTFFSFFLLSSTGCGRAALETTLEEGTSGEDASASGGANGMQQGDSPDSASDAQAGGGMSAASSSQQAPTTPCSPVIQASSYNQVCQTAQDCAGVPEPSPCQGTSCINVCPSAAINVSDYPQYLSALSALGFSDDAGGCSCGRYSGPCCVNGTCQVGDACGSTGSDMGADASVAGRYIPPGGPCTGDSHCEVGLTCGYAIADGCAATGVCVPRVPDDGGPPCSSLELVCSCGGITETIGCNFATGYAPAPVDHSGVCSDASVTICQGWGGSCDSPIVCCEPLVCIQAGVPTLPGACEQL